MVLEFKKCFQGVNDISSLLIDFTTISIHDGEPIYSVNQWFNSTLGRMPTTSQPAIHNLFPSYMTMMKPNVKFMLKDK